MVSGDHVFFCGTISLKNAGVALTPDFFYFWKKDKNSFKFAYGHEQESIEILSI
jgi:hypothetical protein